MFPVDADVVAPNWAALLNAEGKRRARTRGKGLAQVSTSIALNCHPGRQLPLNVGQVQVEKHQSSLPALLCLLMP